MEKDVKELGRCMKRIRKILLGQKRRLSHT